jgi:hypothetical protein
MVTYAGDGHLFWQLRMLAPKPTFTANLRSGAAGAADDEKSDADNSLQAGLQDDKFPQLVGGGLGVPGSKERVLSILREKGYTDVIPVVEVGERMSDSTRMFDHHLLWSLQPCT